MLQNDTEIVETKLGELAGRIHQGRTRKSNLVNQIVEAFHQLISNQELPLGVQLVNEVRLAQMLEISRPTLREAVKVLIHDGLLESRRGVGTFVAPQLPRRVKSGLERMTSTTDLIRSTGSTPGTRDLSWETVKVPSEIEAALNLDNDSEVVVISRIRLMDQRPLMWAREYLPLKYLPDKALLNDFDGLSLYDFLSSRLGIRLSHCESSITAWVADNNLASKLEVLVGDALLLLTQTHYQKDGTPVLRSINFHNSKLMEFYLVRTEIAVPK
jgi:GntR family transcriptional regulator